MKGCLSLIALIVVVSLVGWGVSSMHQHFADHAQAVADAIDFKAKAQHDAEVKASDERYDAEVKAKQERHDAQAKANHERRLAWQRAHPVEYAKQVAQQRAEAQRREQASIDAKRRAVAGQRALEAAQAQQSAHDAEVAERQRVAEANQPKADELERADSDLTADKISGNPTKYSNSVVKLKCKVINVVPDLGSNAVCGSVNDDSENLAATLLLTGDNVSSFDAGQVVQFVGTVQAPTEGTNAMGGSMRFPTVRVDFDL